MELPDESADGDHPHDGEEASPERVIDEVGWLNQPASELVDHRRRGEYESRYKAPARRQILWEYIYLVFLLALCAAGLLWIGYVSAATSPEDIRSFGIISYPRDRSFLLVITVALSGIVGGTAFALKWLYHSVAKWTWNKDRLWWRLIVPFLSGILSFFVSSMISAGLLSIFNAEFFKNFYGALGGGFFIGYFSDNVLAALQNLAIKWFGTVDNRYQRKTHGGAAPEVHGEGHLTDSENGSA